MTKHKCPFEMLFYMLSRLSLIMLLETCIALTYIYLIVEKQMHVKRAIADSDVFMHMEEVS